MNRKIIVTASIFGALAVVKGAFGAHGLKEVLTTEQLDQWKTAVNYQFYHTFALLFLAVLNIRSKLIDTAYWCFLIGIILFSGSIYLLASRSLTGLSGTFLGPITPVGGMFFIIGWLSVLVAAIKK